MQRKQRPLHPRTPHRSFHRIRQLVPTCLGPRESSSKRHFNLFIRFCSAQGRDHATDRQTQRQTTLLRSYQQAASRYRCSCCSTDRESPHHRCHPRKKWEILLARRIFHGLHNGLVDVPQIVPSSGVGAPIQYVFPRSHTSSHPNHHLDRFIRFSTVHSSEKRTDICNICNNRPHRCTV